MTSPNTSKMPTRSTEESTQSKWTQCSRRGRVLQVLLRYRHNTNARACWEMMGSQGGSPSCTLTFPFTEDTAEQMLNMENCPAIITAFSPLPPVHVLHFHHNERSLNPNVSGSHSRTRTCFMELEFMPRSVPRRLCDSSVCL